MKLYFIFLINFLAFTLSTSGNDSQESHIPSTYFHHILKRSTNNFAYTPISTQFTKNNLVFRKVGVITPIGSRPSSGTPVSRTKAIKRVMTNMGKLKGDQIAHIVAAKHGGSGSDPTNVWAQLGQINQGSWKSQEKLISKAILKENGPTQVTHELAFSPMSGRPVAIKVTVHGKRGDKVFASSNPRKGVDDHKDPAHRIRLVEMGKSFFQDKAAKVKAKYKVMNTQRTKILKAAKTAKLKKSSSSDNRLAKARAMQAKSRERRLVARNKKLSTSRIKSIGRIGKRVTSNASKKLGAKVIKAIAKLVLG